MKTPDFRPPQPQRYSLSLDDFKKSPEHITEYKLGDRVTRENFVDLLILSFAISRGRPNIQATFFTWLDKKYGFDYKLTLRCFVQQKRFFFFKEGWEHFSREEKAKFKDAFESVKGHTGTARLPRDFPRQMEILFDGDDRGLALDLDFENIKSISEFSQNQAVKDYFDK